MKRISKLLMILILTLILIKPAYASNIGFGNYTPPKEVPTGLEAIMEDANNFISSYYRLPEGGGEFFLCTVLTGPYDALRTVPLLVQEDYNISDTSDNMGVTAPMLYYEKEGGGPGRDKQYLGQTKDEFTITNVRFPLNANWGFLEDLEWAPYGDKDAIKWWTDKNNNIPKKLEINEQANSNVEFAKLLDFCIGAATLPQLRNWNGQQYYISKAMANTSGQPGQPGQVLYPNYELASSFPWHKYVNVLVPPTYNTWGYGIGFYQYNGSYSYKSFPISPLRTALAPDFYPTPEGSDEWQPEYKDPAVCAKTYTAKAGETIKIPVNINNSGEKAKTDFKAVWFGHGSDAVGGWNNPFWQSDPKDVQLDKNGQQTFTVPVTVPPAGQETRLVFKCNVNVSTPAEEMNQGNNTMVIRIQPEGVDLAITVTPVSSSYKVGGNSPVNPAANITVSRKDSGTEPVSAVLTITTPTGTQNIDTALNSGEKYRTVARFTTSNAGTYTISAQVWPKAIQEINPADNVDSCTLVVTKVISPKREDTDSGIRVNLGG